MQEKVFVIPFNRFFVLESHRAAWAFSNNKKVKLYIVLSVAVIFFFAISFNIENGDKVPLMNILFGFCVFFVCITWIRFFKRKISYFKKAKDEIIRYEQLSGEFTFVCSDFCFEYRDKYKSIKLSWSLFRPLVTYKDNILLIFKNGEVSFSIDKHELGDKNYNELYQFIKEKTEKS